MEHLISHGRRQIAFIAGSPDDLSGDSGRRLQAFFAACAHFGLEQDARRVVYGRHVYDGGFAAADQLLQSGIPFDALIASNDESAIGAMDAIKQAGKRIPEDVAVIGFDNRLEGAVQQPGLTSIHVPLFDMGYQAVEQMYRHLVQGELLPPHREDVHLVVRSSCGCGGNGEAFLDEEVSAGRPLFQQMAAQIRKQAFDLSADSARFHPGALRARLNQPRLSYANVPYRIKPYADLLQGPYNTILFDRALHERIEAESRQHGTDARLLRDANGEVLHASLTEKLLTLLLAKLVNFVPEGGIWMNTQRPEWNDANNALVGRGLSVVTLGYLRRFLAFFRDLIQPEDGDFPLHTEIAILLENIAAILGRFAPVLEENFTPEQRRAMMDALGEGEAILNLFEETFRHAEFTGRSGTFFAYEGLGSVYWHMVSKLLLAAQETALRFQDTPFAADLVAAYRAIREGLGYRKSPAEYGAFRIRTRPNTTGRASRA